MKGELRYADGTRRVVEVGHVPPLVWRMPELVAVPPFDPDAVVPVTGVRHKERHFTLLWVCGVDCAYGTHHEERWAVYEEARREAPAGAKKKARWQHLHPLCKLDHELRQLGEAT